MTVTNLEDNMLNVIIYSKDRPMQLNALLNSMKLNAPMNDIQPSVVYKSTTEGFQKGYEILINNNPRFNFIQETNFKQNTLKRIDNARTYTLFLVDDVIFTHHFNLKDKQFSYLDDRHVVSLSLRLSKHIDYCYAIDRKIALPKFVKSCIWKWYNQEGDWGYPFSLDGNVYLTGQIKRLISNINFNNPNELEAQLNSIQNPHGYPPYMCCYPEQSRLLNVPTNRVQNQFQNRVENSYTIEELNDRFLKGDRIYLEPFQGIKNNAVHYPMPFEFIAKRETE